jgi:hypothetical protein
MMVMRASRALLSVEEPGWSGDLIPPLRPRTTLTTDGDLHRDRK